MNADKIIVMDKGYASKPNQVPLQDPGGPRGGPGGISTLRRVLINEIIPMIDANYRTLADRGHRAMAGLSMGANQTIQITMNNLDKFSYIGGFSGTSNFPNTTEIDPATLQAIQSGNAQYTQVGQDDNGGAIMGLVNWATTPPDAPVTEGLYL
jgi:predicted alpha/beta superfamily hydrolase